MILFQNILNSKMKKIVAERKTRKTEIIGKIASPIHYISRAKIIATVHSDERQAQREVPNEIIIELLTKALPKMIEYLINAQVDLVDEYNTDDKNKFVINSEKHNASIICNFAESVLHGRNDMLTIRVLTVIDNSNYTGRSGQKRITLEGYDEKSTNNTKTIFINENGKISNSDGAKILINKNTLLISKDVLNKKQMLEMLHVLAKYDIKNVIVDESNETAIAFFKKYL